MQLSNRRPATRSHPTMVSHVRGNIKVDEMSVPEAAAKVGVATVLSLRPLGC